MHNTAKVVRMAVVTVVVASLGPWAAPSRPGSARSPVTPNVDLVDFQRVELTGVGLEPGLHEWSPVPAWRGRRVGLRRVQRRLHQRRG